MRQIKKWTQKEVDILKNNYGKIRAKEIAKILNCTPSRVISKAKQLGLKSNIKSNFDTINKIKESTKNNKYVEYKTYFNKKIKLIKYIKNNKYEFQCYCGKLFITKLDKVRTGHTKSCGCTSFGKRKGTIYISSTYWTSLKQGAEMRNINFNISIEEAENILIKQNFKCALSGVQLIIGYKNLKELTMSLDRIDSNKPYVIDNIQWIHKDINMSKQSFSNKKFIEMCINVAKHQKSILYGCDK